MAFYEDIHDDRPGESIQYLFTIDEELDIPDIRTRVLPVMKSWTSEHGFGPIREKTGYFFSDKLPVSRDTNYISVHVGKRDSSTGLKVGMSGKSANKAQILELSTLLKNVIIGTTGMSSVETTKPPIPSGSEDAVTMDEIKDGEAMVDFQDEFENGRYYKESTFPKLNRKNPFTRKAIAKYSKYTAKVADKGGKRRRRKTRKARRSKRI